MRVLPSTVATPTAAFSVRADWLAAAARLSGKSLHLALALAWLAARSGAPGVLLTRRTLARWSVSRDACYDGLRRIEAVGLIKVWRAPGRAPWVILLEPGQNGYLDVPGTAPSLPPRPLGRGGLSAHPDIISSTRSVPARSGGTALSFPL